MWIVKRDVKCRVQGVKCRVRCGVRSAGSAKCGVGSEECKVWSAKPRV